MTGPRGLGPIVAGIYCVLDWTSVGSIPLATDGTFKQLSSDMYLISCFLYGQLLLIMCVCQVMKLKTSGIYYYFIRRKTYKETYFSFNDLLSTIPRPRNLRIAGS